MILIKLIHKCLCRSSKHNMKMKCIFSAYPPALNKDSKHTATHSGHERQIRLYNRAPIVFLQLLNDYYIIIALISNSCCFTITHNFLPMFPIRATLSTMHKTQSTDGSEKNAFTRCVPLVGTPRIPVPQIEQRSLSVHFTTTIRKMKLEKIHTTTVQFC